MINSLLAAGAIASSVIPTAAVKPNIFESIPDPSKPSLNPPVPARCAKLTWNFKTGDRNKIFKSFVNDTVYNNVTHDLQQNFTLTLEEDNTNIWQGSPLTAVDVNKSLSEIFVKQGQTFNVYILYQAWTKSPFHHFITSEWCCVYLTINFAW